MKKPMRGGQGSRNRARHLRRNPTDAEKRLWRALRPLRHTHAIHTRRQMPLGPYIADFAIVAQNLVIEIDGGHHGGEADAGRDTWMTERGWRVLRFWNTDISDNLEGVMETIYEACGARHPANDGGMPEINASGTPPRSSRGGAGVGCAAQPRGTDSQANQ